MNIIIPVIAFIIGGCIGIKCGGEYVLYMQKQYLKSDEWEKRNKEIIKELKNIKENFSKIES